MQIDDKTTWAWRRSANQGSTHRATKENSDLPKVWDWDEGGRIIIATGHCLTDGWVQHMGMFHPTYIWALDSFPRRSGITAFEWASGLPCMSVALFLHYTQVEIVTLVASKLTGHAGANRFSPICLKEQWPLQWTLERYGCWNYSYQRYQRRRGNYWSDKKRRGNGSMVQQTTSSWWNYFCNEKVMSHFLVTLPHMNKLNPQW